MNSSYPTSPEEAYERWRLRIKYDLLVLKANDELEGDLALERLARRYHFFARRMEQYDNDELLELYLNSITTSFDPHTTYMSRSTHENFLIMMRLNLQGYRRIAANDRRLHDCRPGDSRRRRGDLEGSLKAEDRVVSVGEGEEGELVNVEDMKLGDVVSRIRGHAGTIVRLGVVHKDQQNVENPEIEIIRIVRAEVQLTDQEARGEVLEAGTDADGTPFLVGVINLPSFYMDMEAARSDRGRQEHHTRRAGAYRKLQGAGRRRRRARLCGTTAAAACWKPSA